MLHHPMQLTEAESAILLSLKPWHVTSHVCVRSIRTISDKREHVANMIIDKDVHCLMKPRRNTNNENDDPKTTKSNDRDGIEHPPNVTTSIFCFVFETCWFRGMFNLC